MRFIEEEERLQREAFELLQQRKDYQHNLITNQIVLVESELATLTQAELTRKALKVEGFLVDLVAQRARLAQLLAQLLAAKEAREAQLKGRAKKMAESAASRRLNAMIGDDFWLIQYQNLMLQSESFTDLLRRLDFDANVAAILLQCRQDKVCRANYF